MSGHKFSIDDRVRVVKASEGISGKVGTIKDTHLLGSGIDATTEYGVRLDDFPLLYWVPDGQMEPLVSGPRTELHALIRRK